MRDRTPFFLAVLDSTYGQNREQVKCAIKAEFKDYQENRTLRRNYFSASTVLAGRTGSFLQAQKVVSLWADIPFES